MLLSILDTINDNAIANWLFDNLGIFGAIVVAILFVLVIILLVWLVVLLIKWVIFKPLGLIGKIRRKKREAVNYISSEKQGSSASSVTVESVPATQTDPAYAQKHKEEEKQESADKADAEKAEKEAAEKAAAEQAEKEAADKADAEKAEKEAAEKAAAEKAEAERKLNEEAAESEKDAGGTPAKAEDESEETSLSGDAAAAVEPAPELDEAEMLRQQRMAKALALAEHERTLIEKEQRMKEREENKRRKQELEERIRLGYDGKWEIVKDDNGSFRFRLIASNGELLCQSEAYASKRSVKLAAEQFTKCLEQDMYELYEDKNEVFQIKFYTEAGKLMLVGETYSSSSSARASIDSIKRFSKTAHFIDLTIPKKEPVKKASAKKTGK